MTYNIFVSYSSKDAEIAKKVQKYFGQIQGTSVFLAENELIIGSLSQAIIQFIRQSDLFLVLYSRNSHSSTYVQQEIGVALGNNKIIIPILLDAEAKPDAMIGNVQYLSIYDEQKRNEQLPRLYSYIVQQTQRKAGNTALLGLGALALLYYAAKEEENL